MGNSPSPLQNAILPVRPLGATGSVLPILGFGISGALSSPAISHSKAINLIAEARQLGISVFDTAPFYGNGLAEQRLADGLNSTAMLSHLPPPFIITKGGTFRKDRTVQKDFSYHALRQQLVESTSRLGQVDAFFVHGPGNANLSEELFNVLARLKSEGLFKFSGIAGRGSELDKAIDSEAFDIVMAPLHADLPAKDLDRLETARSKNIGIIGIEALAPAAQGIRLSLKPADLWYSARAIARRKILPTQHLSASQCLRWVTQSGLADIVLSTTTRSKNLIDNVRSCSEKVEINAL